MNDLNYKVLNLIQNAQGQITITDYTQLAGKTVTVNGNVLTAGVNFTAATSNDATATSLKTAIDALANVNASVVANVITVGADAPGTAGNAYGLATNATGGITLSGATLSGGVAASYSQVMELGAINPLQLDAVIDIDDITGAAATATITPETSLDKENWIARTASAALNATGVTELHTTEPLAYVRYKIVLAGTTPKVSLKINAKASN